MTPERIAELRALADAATPGPWAWINLGDKGGNAWFVGTVYDTREEEMVWLSGEIVPEPYNEATGKFERVADYDQRIALNDDTVSRVQDAAFIAAARTALPEALDAIERVRAKIKVLSLYNLKTDDYTINAERELLAALEGKSDG
jgi:hypothetical protein